MIGPLIKRGIDIVLCLVALPIALPLCLLLLILIRLETAGSPLFVQTRLGRELRPFRMLKLRTMARDTGDLPSHEVGEHRITRLGRLIRALKLDELPQLLNVLVGSMSLVGPRPCLPSQMELIAERKARGVFDFRPGITGPAQLSGVDMSEPARLAQIEEAYYRSATPLDDIRMILRTAFGQGFGDAAIRAPDA